MDIHGFLITTLIFLGAAVIAVPLFKRFGLASVLGYLAAGSIIGPSGLYLISDVKTTLGFAELGVVLLLFVIGLELKPSRLWVLRKSVFGLGGAQVVLTAIPLILVALWAGQGWGAAAVIGLSLAFSSTAFALQILAERKQLSTHFGRSAFAVLLFQDLAAIPLLALIPLLVAGDVQNSTSPWLAVAKVLGAMAGIVFGGRYLLRPAFRAIAATKTSELFTMATLLLVCGVAVLMEAIGLSMALGAFLAGVLLADSEYRHELEADIEPFKGILLGLFFIAVGMAADYSLLGSAPLLVLGLVVGLLSVKFTVLFGLGRASGLSSEAARHFAFTLPQGGEFAFVIFTAAAARGVMTSEVSDLLIVVVTLSMALTPFLVWFNDRFLSRWLAKDKKPFDEIRGEEPEVIIAGVGRVGQITARTLRVLGIPFTALDADANQVEVLRKFGHKVYYGDASKIDLLKAAGAEHAKVFVLAIDDVENSLRTAEIVRQHFPHLRIVARARNRGHAFRLLDLGVTAQKRETLASSVEMAEAVLNGLGFGFERAHRIMSKFRAHDDQMLVDQHRVHKDEKQLISASQAASRQLAELLSADLNDDVVEETKAEAAL